jgi:rhamnose utilization protein RhaD (predicted bifunctional aldolase and dehydrogenase)
MSNDTETLSDLVRLSNTIGHPSWDCAILGEGNTSLGCDDGSFFVKGSGCSLETMTAADFVQMRRQPMLDLLQTNDDSAEALQVAYQAAKVDPAHPRRPSLETVFHAVLLNYTGVNAVAHVHATAVNMLLCTDSWREHLRGRLCPDEAVVLGRDSVFVPYVDPGIQLARVIHREVDAYIAKHSERPRVVYLQNHGPIALGSSTREAQQIIQMCVKAARMRLGAIQAGGIAPLPDAEVAHLLGRPDERYRQSVLAGR